MYTFLTGEHYMAKKAWRWLKINQQISSLSPGYGPLLYQKRNTKSHYLMPKTIAFKMPSLFMRYTLLCSATSLESYTAQ
jgi:hypothetical protein